MNGAFSFTDDSQGYRLDAAGTQAAFDFAPQQRRDLVADQPVQYPAGLLRLILRSVKALRRTHCLFDGIFGQFMEKDAVEIAPLFFKYFGCVPGDSLPFTIGVRCQVNVGCIPGSLF